MSVKLPLGAAPPIATDDFSAAAAELRALRDDIVAGRPPGMTESDMYVLLITNLERMGLIPPA